MANLSLKAWLKDNPLTPDPTDKTAVISSNGTLTEDDILDRIMEDGIELKRDTLKSVITRYKNKLVELVLSGYNVNTGVVYMHPLIKGVFYDKTWNPAVNSVHVNMIQGAVLRKACAGTTVEILGERSDLIELYSVTDTATGNTNSSLTKGCNAELKGAYIKIAGDAPANGIFFRNTITGVETKLPASNIVLNERSRLLILVPAELEAGEYELRVTTQTTSNSKTFLKNPHSVSLAVPVVIA